MLPKSLSPAVKLSLALVALLLIGVASYSAYQSRNADRSTKAAEKYFLATEEFRLETEALTKEKGVKDRSELTGPLPDLDARFAKSTRAFDGVSADFRGTKEAYLSALQLARLHAELGTKETAMKWFDRAAESATDPLERSAVALGKGYLELTAKNPQEAKKRFEEALAMGGPDTQKADALLGLARAAHEAKDSALAISSLQRLAKEYPQAPQALVAEALQADWK